MLQSANAVLFEKDENWYLFFRFRKYTKKAKRTKNKIFVNLVILVVFGIKYILGINIIFGMNYFQDSERICVT